MSLDIDLNLKRYFSDALKILLILSAVLLSIITFRDVGRRRREELNRKKLLKILAKQKKLLEKKFSSSALNFAQEENFRDQLTACPDSNTKEGKDFLTSPDDNLPLTEKTQPQVGENLEGVIVEGEDISSFPPEWQDFLKKNKGKSTAEKINQMLK